MLVESNGVSYRGFYRLANAVLLQAIQDAISASTGRRASALRWMSRPDHVSCYSFPFICRILNRSPEDVRRFCVRKSAERQIPSALSGQPN